MSDAFSVFRPLPFEVSRSCVVENSRVAREIIEIRRVLRYLQLAMIASWLD